MISERGNYYITLLLNFLIFSLISVAVVDYSTSTVEVELEMASAEAGRTERNFLDKPFSLIAVINWMRRNGK